MPHDFPLGGKPATFFYPEGSVMSDARIRPVLLGLMPGKTRAVVQLLMVRPSKAGIARPRASRVARTAALAIVLLIAAGSLRAGRGQEPPPSQAQDVIRSEIPADPQQQ